MGAQYTKYTQCKQWLPPELTFINTQDTLNKPGTCGENCCGGCPTGAVS